jgi:hypothetical protein
MGLGLGERFAASVDPAGMPPSAGTADQTDYDEL